MSEWSCIIVPASWLEKWKWSTKYIELPVCKNELSSGCYTVALCGFHTPQYIQNVYGTEARIFLLCCCQGGVIRWLGRVQTLLNIFETYRLVRWEEKTHMGRILTGLWTISDFLPFFHKVEVCVKSACLTTPVSFSCVLWWDFIRWERTSPWTRLPCGPVWLRQRKWLCIKGRGLAFCGTLSPVTQGLYGRRLHWCCLLNTSTDVHCRDKHPVL